MRLGPGIKSAASTLHFQSYSTMSRKEIITMMFKGVVIIVTLYLMLLLLQTDDKGVFSTSLSEEYLIAAQTFSLSTMDLFELSSLAINCIFDEDIKLELMKLWG